MEKNSSEPVFEKELKTVPDAALSPDPQNGELKPKKERSQREIVELKDRLRFVAKALSNNFDLRVIAGQGWAAGLSDKFSEERRKHPEKSLEDLDQKLLIPEVMTYPEKDMLEKSEDYIWGVFRHEMSHIKHSDYQSLLEAQDWAKEEGYSPSDLFFVYDAWEDGRSNNMEGQTSKTAKRRLGTYLAEDVAGTLLLNLEEKPISVQYGALCWAKGAEDFIDGFDFGELLAKVTDERVLSAYKETEEVLHEYLNERAGRKAFTETLWKKGWPVFKNLIDKQIEEDAEKNFEKDTKKGETEYGEPDKKWGDLTPEEKEKYREAPREKLTEEEMKVMEILKPKSVDMSMLEDGTYSGGFRTVTKEDIEKSDKEEEIFNDEKKMLAEEAESLRNEESRKKRGELEKLKQRESGLGKEEKELYDEYFSAVRGQVGLFAEKLDVLFPTEEGAEIEWEGGSARGKRVNTKRIASEIPTGHGKIFETKTVPEIKQLAFILLIDISGSMSGENIQEALKAAILMGEAFSRKGIPFEILAFHGKLLILKSFDDPYNGKKKMDIMKILEEVKTMDAAWNDDGYAVDTASRRLQKRFLENEADGALIVLSDGSPAPSFAHSGPEWNLNTVVDRWSKRIPLIGVGIGPGMDKTISRFYGKNGLSVSDVSVLSRTLLSTLDRQLSRFGRKSS